MLKSHTFPARRAVPCCAVLCGAVVCPADLQGGRPELPGQPQPDPCTEHHCHPGSTGKPTTGGHVQHGSLTYSYKPC